MRPLSSSPDLRFWSLLSPSFHAGDHDVNDNGEKEDDNGDHDEEYEGDDDDDQEESKTCSPASSQLARSTHSCACHRLGAWSSTLHFNHFNSSSSHFNYFNSSSLHFNHFNSPTLNFKYLIIFLSLFQNFNWDHRSFTSSVRSRPWSRPRLGEVSPCVCPKNLRSQLYLASPNILLLQNIVFLQTLWLNCLS